MFVIFSRMSGRRAKGSSFRRRRESAMPRAAGLSAYCPHSEVGSICCRFDAAMPSMTFRRRSMAMMERDSLRKVSLVGWRIDWNRLDATFRRVNDADVAATAEDFVAAHAGEEPRAILRSITNNNGVIVWKNDFLIDWRLGNSDVFDANLAQAQRSGVSPSSRGGIFTTFPPNNS